MRTLEILQKGIWGNGLGKFFNANQHQQPPRKYFFNDISCFSVYLLDTGTQWIRNTYPGLLFCEGVSIQYDWNLILNWVFQLLLKRFFFCKRFNLEWLISTRKGNTFFHNYFANEKVKENLRDWSETNICGQAVFVRIICWCKRAAYAPHPPSTGAMLSKRSWIVITLLVRFNTAIGGGREQKQELLNKGSRKRERWSSVSLKL